MSVKDRDAVEALDSAEAKLRAATEDVESARALLREIARSDPAGLTLRDLTDRFAISQEVVVALLETLGELIGERSITVKDARRAGMLAAAGQAWENELGPSLSSAQVRELLGDVSRQRVDELLRARRLIGLRDASGRRRFPVFQFREDGRPLDALVAAYWTLAAAAISDWTAASWCVATDDALDGRSPLAWAREGRDPERLAHVAAQDAARLAR
jgi:hypothetical protein